MRRLTLSLAALMAMTLALPAAAQQPTQLNAAVGDNMNHVPSFVGVEKGLFLKQGIDLKLKVLATGQQMSQALQAGEVQIIGSAYSNYPLAVERGMAAKGVVGLMGDRSASTGINRSPSGRVKGQALRRSRSSWAESSALRPVALQMNTSALSL